MIPFTITRYSQTNVQKHALKPLKIILNISYIIAKKQ